MMDEKDFQKVRYQIEWSNKLFERYNMDKYYVGNHNGQAYRAVMEIVTERKEGNAPVWICGEIGLGKTHLMQAMVKKIRERNPERKVCYLCEEAWCCAFELALKLERATTEFFWTVLDSIFGDADIWIFDDIDKVEKYPELKSLVKYVVDNWYYGAKQMVLVSEKSLDEVVNSCELEEDTVEILNSGHEYLISMPDYKAQMVFLNGLLREEKEKHGFQFDQEALDFIAKHFGKNYRLLSGAFLKVVAVCRLKGLSRDVNLEMVEAILKESMS